ncbi:MAG: GxxExxY protein, partial [Patescibacteria group bacterium]
MELLHKDKTEIIIGIMFDVYNELGFGYREKYFERAIIKEAKERGIPVNSQVNLPVKYKGEKIGD